MEGNKALIRLPTLTTRIKQISLLHRSLKTEPLFYSIIHASLTTLVLFALGLKKRALK